MAFEYMDGCEQYTINADLASRYTNVDAGVDFLASGSNFSNQAIELPGAAVGQSFRRTLNSLSYTNEVYFAFWFYTDTVVAGFGDRVILEVVNDNATPAIRLAIRRNGALRIIDAGNVTATSVNGSYSAATWHHVELQFRFAEAAGDPMIELRIDGVAVITNNTLRTADTSDLETLDYFNIGSNESGLTSRIDDIVVHSEANFIGEHRIGTLLPDADTVDADFTRVSGSANFEAVDEAGGPDANVLTGETAGDEDFYDIGALPWSPTTIHAVSVGVVSRTTGAPDKTQIGKIRSDGFLGTGATNTIGTTTEFNQDIFELDPDGSVAWVEAQVNALEIGMERDT